MQLIRQLADEAHEALFARAIAAGEQAAVAVVPSPILVRDDPGWTGRPGPVIDILIHGDCGSSYVVIRDGRGAFAKWLVRSGRGHRHYRGRGVTVYAPERSQSLARAQAFSRAMARVFNEAGLRTGVEDLID